MIDGAGDSPPLRVARYMRRNLANRSAQRLTPPRCPAGRRGGASIDPCPTSRRSPLRTSPPLRGQRAGDGCRRRRRGRGRRDGVRGLPQRPVVIGRRHRRGSAVRRRHEVSRASTTPTTASSSSSSAAASPRSTATTTGSTTSTSPADGTRRALPQRQPGGRRAALRAGDLARTDLTAVTGAYPLDVDSDGLPTWPSCASGRTSCCEASATAASKSDRRPGDSTGVTSGRPRSARPGRDERGCRRSPSATTATDRRRRVRRQLVRPSRTGGRRLRRADRAHRVLHAVDPVLRLGSVGPARPADGERPPLLHRRPRAALAGRARAPRRAYTEAEGWRPLQIWGMGIASRT